MWSPRQGPKQPGVNRGILVSHREGLLAAVPCQQQSFCSSCPTPKLGSENYKVDLVEGPKSVAMVLHIRTTGQGESPGHAAG